MKNLLKLFLFSLTLLGGHAMAATIGWSTAPSIISVSDTFSLSITGSDFTSNVDGGGVNIAYDSSVLNVISVTVNETDWEFYPSAGTIDNSTGVVDGIMVNTFENISGNFDVATIMFEAIGSGTSVLSLSEYGLNPWSSGGSLINPAMIDSSVSVSAVPVPAAVWLFGSGIIGLLGVAKRKSCV